MHQVGIKPMNLTIMSWALLLFSHGCLLGILYKVKNQIPIEMKSFEIFWINQYDLGRRLLHGYLNYSSKLSFYMGLETGFNK